LEIEKRTVGSSTGLREVTGGMGLLRNERKDVQDTALGKENDGGTPGKARTLSGNRSGRAALRREQLESNHREIRATGKEGTANHRRHKQNPGNCRMPVGYSGRITLRRE
jgi:hypothetical protein